MKRGDVVLVDTNVIIEGHLRGCWAALTGAFAIETVVPCITEAMSGHHNWGGARPTEHDLCATFSAIHEVSQVELAEVLINGGGALDAGEKALWAHALGRSGAWVLCGPDRASMRFGYEQGQRSRLVSLGGLLDSIGYCPKDQLRNHFEQQWLDDVIRKLILGLL